MPNAAASIARAVEVAHRAGTLVVLTAGDPGLVRRNRPQLLEALRQGADVLFTNRCVRCNLAACCAAPILPLHDSQCWIRRPSTVSDKPMATAHCEH